MPIVSPRKNLTPANMRATDVASRLTESVTAIQQQRTIAAFRVQGFQCILYNRLQQGRACPCCTKSETLAKLSPDGKAAPGIINRVLTGNPDFEIVDYNPQIQVDNWNHGTTSRSEHSGANNGTLIGSGSRDVEDFNLISDEPMFGDNGQHSPDLDELLGDFDLGQIGLTDVSCAVCFGSGYIGGYVPYKGFRTVLVGQDLETASYLNPETWELSPGTHTARVVLPRGVVQLDAFRLMRQARPVPFTLTIDGESTTGMNLLRWFDGQPHVLEFRTLEDITHFELQGALTSESTFFEFPRRPKSGDISMLERTDPFQVLMSPDVPSLEALDIVTESQTGRVLVVGSTSPWATGKRNPLGIECQVRVAQPQELWNCLPVRRPLIGQRPSNPVPPSKRDAVSGVGINSFTF